MTPDTHTGKIGEDFVTNLLIDKGYTLIARNFHSRQGEIDIIVRDDKYIIFVEVKTRKKYGMSLPVEAVTKSKQEKILYTAKYFLMKYKTSLQPRFDVAAIETCGDRVASLNYITNAFME